MTVRSLDAQVSGSFRFELEHGSSIVGTYLAIVPPEKLVFTWSAGAAPGQETVVTLDFLEQGAVTEVVLTHEHLATPERHAVAAGGWSSCFDALASVLSSAHLDWWRLSNTGSRGADHRQSSRGRSGGKAPLDTGPLFLYT
jgi:uncharacterized protein YndB with AHSA1/START domain